MFLSLRPGVQFCGRIILSLLPACRGVVGFTESAVPVRDRFNELHRATVALRGAGSKTSLVGLLPDMMIEESLLFCGRRSLWLLTDLTEWEKIEAGFPGGFDIF